MIIGIILLIILCVPIGIAYYYDFKNNPNEFKIEFSQIKKWLYTTINIVIIHFSINAISPLYSNRGLDFNDERQKNGIPLLNKNWKKDKHSSSQYRDAWADFSLNNGHFRKETKYGIFYPKSELDYYTSILSDTIIVWSIYDYNKKTTQDFTKKPKENQISITKKGNIKIEPNFVTVEISKSEFEKHIK